MENKKSIIAITGPSGAGKTTLSNKLKLLSGIDVPFHCTTRNKRLDDDPMFYRYLTHEEYAKLFLENKFLLSSGDSEIIKKENGNFYGVLYEDCIDKWKYNDIIILLVSYKDLERLLYLQKNGYNINIVNLTFIDIEKGVRTRIDTNKRKLTQLEIYKRIQCALNYEKIYGDIIKKYANCLIYTDKTNINETYETVCKKLKLIK